LLLNTTSTLT
jgi:hypothetical protein